MPRDHSREVLAHAVDELGVRALHEALAEGLDVEGALGGGDGGGRVRRVGVVRRHLHREGRELDVRAAAPRGQRALDESVAAVNSTLLVQGRLVGEADDEGGPPVRTSK